MSQTHVLQIAETLSNKLFSPTVAYSLLIAASAVSILNDLDFIAWAFPTFSAYKEQIFNTSGSSLVFYSAMLAYAPRDFWGSSYLLAVCAMLAVTSGIHFLS